MRAFERKIRWAGRLIAAGLVVQVAASTVVHPLAFVAFLLLACPITVAGMLLFLWALANTPESGSRSES